MSSTYLILGGAAVASAGVVGMVWALRPAPPSLDSIRAQLTARPISPATSTATAKEAQQWWSPYLATISTWTIGVREEDLELCDISRTAHTVKKLLYTAVILMAGPLIALLAWALALPAPPMLTTGIAMVIAAGFWWANDKEIQEKADTLREEMRAAVAIYLQWVAQERSAGQGAAGALKGASLVPDTWCFRQIRDEIRASELTREEPWAGLRRLGDRYEIPELGALASVMDSAADGAAVYNTLIAEAESHEEAQANVALTRAKERTSALETTPAVLLAIGGITLLFFPLLANIN